MASSMRANNKKTQPTTHDRLRRKREEKNETSFKFELLHLKRTVSTTHSVSVSLKSAVV